MASLDSANGPSATVWPFFHPTILPSSINGWADLTFPCPPSRSNQALHWPITFCSSSGERLVSQCVPRNNSIYADVVDSIFILFAFSCFCLIQIRFEAVQQVR